MPKLFNPKTERRDSVLPSHCLHSAQKAQRTLPLRVATNGAEAVPAKSLSQTGSTGGAGRASTIMTRAQRAAMVTAKAATQAVNEVEAVSKEQGMTASLADISEVGQLADVILKGSVNEREPRSMLCMIV